jgi:hypothetical protein
MTDEETKDAQIENLRITGDEVSQMNDKHFEITAEPFYEPVPNKPEEKRLIVPINLANGTKAQWQPNKTSQKVIVAKRGRALRDWVGFKGEWLTRLQVIGQLGEKNVIYLK